MSRRGGDDEEEEASGFHDSLERISSSDVSIEIDEEEGREVDDDDSSTERSGSDQYLIAPKLFMGESTYEMWTSEPVSSVKERRCRLLKQMGLASDLSLSGGKSGRSVKHFDSCSCCWSDGEASSSCLNDLNICYVNRLSNDENGGGILSGNMSSRALLNKPPTGRNTNFESVMMPNIVSDSIGMEEGVFGIKKLDKGKKCVRNGVGEDAMCSKVKEVGTWKQLPIEECDMCGCHSPLGQELMRRKNVEGGNKDELEAFGSGGNGLNPKKKGSWLKNLRIVTRTLAGQKERRSSDDRDIVSGRSGRRFSSATDDSQDNVFHGPERVRVRQNGKSSKELSALYKSQEISAHSGSIWSIKFSLDGKYLATAGEDCVIHVWQVVGSERKGDLLIDDIDSNTLFWDNGSPRISSPVLNTPADKMRRNRSSLARKSSCIKNICVPETIFAISDKQFCSFHGHTDDVLDLSWSKSQYLLSSSVDKTVRLWHLSSQSCLKIFSHNDYVTCIHFNPADDRYFLSGSLDAKVRIWSIPGHQVVDWTDLHEMVTAACYTPDGQGAWVGSYKGTCRRYSITENKLVQNRQINLQNMNKKSRQKKITGFQFTPGSLSEVLVTSADSRVRVIDGGDELVHKFKGRAAVRHAFYDLHLRVNCTSLKGLSIIHIICELNSSRFTFEGFRNTQTQISASITRNGRYIIAASEDSNVYMWRLEVDTGHRESKTVTVTQAYENFHCQDVSVAVPWCGSDEENAQIDKDGSSSNSPTIIAANMTIGIMPGYSVHDERRRRRRRTDLSSYGMLWNKSAWGMVIVTGGLRGELKTFQNFGLPTVRK